MPAQPAKTRLYIAGGPGGSSVGPKVHEYVAQSLGLPWKCDFLQLPTIKEVMTYFQDPDFAGAVVTMPHKRTIIPFLHYSDDLVKIMGACNLVYLSPDGQFCGTNTDWVGIYDAIRDKCPDHTPGRTGMVYGAGGASRAAIYALWAKLKCDKIYVVNRDDREVEELLNDVHRLPDLYWPEIVHVRGVAEAVALTEPYYIVSTIPDFEPITLQEQEARKILVEFLSRKTAPGILLDMCYHPPMTRILKLGIQYEFKIIQGFTVVGSQFPCQWKLWTGKTIERNGVFEMIELLVREHERDESQAVSAVR